jgi:hypothetical protein
MEFQKFANNVRALLGLDAAPISAADIASGLVDKYGRLGAYIDPTTRLLTQPGNLRNRRVVEDFAALDANDAVSVIQPTGAARASTTGLLHHLYTPGGNIFGCANIGVQTTSPVMSAAGLDIAGATTNAIGTELFTNFAGATGRPFIVGLDPAFFFRVSLTIADISGATVLLAGFRRAEANNITYTSYADYGAIGTIASAATGAINIAQEINGAGTSPTDTTNTWADGETKILEIRVSATGVVSYTINGAAPTVVPDPQTFDDGDPLIPFVHFIQHTDDAGAITINSWEVGHQLTP